jgi:hypothetical protein
MSNRYRITGPDLARTSTRRLADEIPSPQRLPKKPLEISPQRLRQLAADRQRYAAGLARHLPQTAHASGWQPRIAASWAARRIAALEAEARDLNAQAAALEAAERSS